MTPTAMRDASPAFRLSGEVGGTPLVYVLQDGDNLIGRAEGCELRVNDKAISHRHAVIRLDGDHIEIEDLGSKNGTYLNANRITTAQAHPGDKIRVGPLLASFEAVDPGDVQLAVRIPPPPDRQPTTIAFTSASRTATHDCDPRPRLLELARDIFEWCLVDGASEDTVLVGLMDGLGGTGACLAELRGDAELTIVAAVGDDVTLAAIGHRPGSRESRSTQAQAHLPSRERLSSAPVIAVERSAGDGRHYVLAVTSEQCRTELATTVLDIALLGMTMGAPGSPRRPSRRAAPSVGFLDFPEGHVVGRSPAMTRLYDRLTSLASSDGPVLITGETGVGKEQIAHILHLSSSRSEGPFQVVDCAVIARDLSESELFGIESGVATGVDARPGRILQADGGVLFLDEVGDMRLDQQAMLLRMLQEKAFTPLGGKAPLKVDVRVVAATNKDLARQMRSGEFREDLYHRLAGHVVRVPPLRERRQDIAALATHIVRRAAVASGVFIPGISRLAMERIKGAQWPGNVRQLENVLEDAALACPDGMPIDSSMVQAMVEDVTEPAMDALVDCHSLDHRTRMAECERHLVRTALARAKHNKAEAARLLSVSRNGLLKMIHRLGIQD